MFLRNRSACLAVLLWTSPVWAGELAGGIFSESLTENLGVGDPIPYVELDFRYGAVQPYAFEKRELVDSNGYHWTYYYFQLPAGERRVTAQWEVGGGATGASLSASSRIYDWSSRSGVSSNPFYMETGRYYRLAITSEAPSRFSGLRSDYFYFTVEQGDESPAPDNSPPTLRISPDPGANLQWQQEILVGNGFSIIVEDPDGVSDLDLATFQVAVAGVDKTAHFLNVADTLATEGRLFRNDSVDALVFTFKPDPARFASDHNLFNFQWNNEWPIRLKVCDRQGECAQSHYAIYVGPFLTIGSATDQRCAGEPQDAAHPIRIAGYHLGNIGFTAPVADVYLGVKDGINRVLTYYQGQLGVMLLSDALHPLLGAAGIPMPAGFHLEGDIDVVSTYLYEDTSGYQRFAQLRSEDITFLTAVRDRTTYALPIGEYPLTICGP